MTFSHRHLLLLLALSPMLHGCESLVFLTLHGGWAAQTALQSRPDQKFDYQIDVEIVENKLLRFTGSTDCTHSVGELGGYYSTVSRDSYLQQDGVDWVLSGIDCNNEIVKKNATQYTLFKAVDERQGKVYFVMPGGSAWVVFSSFQPSLRRSSQNKQPPYDKYQDGPYFYRKLFLDRAPHVLAEQIKPVVVYRGNENCGKQNESGVSLRESDFDQLMSSAVKTIAYEEGYLAYQPEVGAWNARPGIDKATTFDAASTTARLGNGGSIVRAESGCMRFLLNNQVLFVSAAAYMSYLYVPAERAFYFIMRVWRHSYEGYVSDKGWQACDKPKNIASFSPATVYMARPGEVARQNLDGKYSCRPRAC